MKMFLAPIPPRFLARLTCMVALLVLAGGLAAPAADAPAKPNIVFILVDDLRWDALSCMGHPVAKTPNIDRIARRLVQELFFRFRCVRQVEAVI
jgi:hypothetical protein